MLTRKSKHDREFAIYRFMCDHVDIFGHKVAPLLSPNDLKRLRSTNKALKFVVDSVGFSMYDENNKLVKENMSSYTRTAQVDWAWSIFKRLWWTDSDETTAAKYFCWRVAMTNSLVLLHHAREVLKLNWDWQTAARAAEIGNLEMLVYIYEHGCEFPEPVCTCAAANGHLACLKYLHETVRARWNENTRIRALIAYFHGNEACVPCFLYARDNGCPRHDEEDEYWDSDDEEWWGSDESEDDDFWEDYFWEELREEFIRELDQW
jgi:hypothetical protein